MTSTQVWRDLPWGLWRRQTAAIVRLELKKNLFSRRAWWIWFLALGPVVISANHSLLLLRRGEWSHSLAQDSTIYAGIFQLFYLRLGIFFGCVGIFTNLFRAELLEKTLHYYLLAPVRREIVAAGKFFAGLAAAVALFASSAGLSYLLIAGHFGGEFLEHLFRGPGLEHLAWYLLVAVLACVGYGSVFLVMGMLFRNPMIPAGAVMLWEAINAFLPPLLKRFSVIFYLKSLCPENVPVRGLMSLIAVEARPAPAWIAVSGLLLVSALVLSYAGVRARSIEIGYGEEAR